MGFVAHDLGVDLGTSNTLVYVRHKGIVINEPTIVVVDSSNERKVRAVGDDAKIMLGRTTEGVMAVRPMREGVITDFDMTEILIQFFMRKAIGSSYIVKPRLFLSYPCSISAIERRAVGEAASRKVRPWMAVLMVGTHGNGGLSTGWAQQHSRTNAQKSGVRRDDDARRATLIPRIKWAGWPDFEAFRSWRTCARIR